MKPGRATSRARAAKRDEPRTGATPLPPRPEFDRLFDALADADRLRLLEQLGALPFNAGRLGPKMGWSWDTTAKQLKLLKRAALVRGEAAGRRVEYARTPSGLTAALGWSSSLWMRLPKVVGLEDAALLEPEQQVALAGALRTAGRRNMLECMCRGGPITQGAAAEDCRLSQGLASRGLKQLVEAGLVEIRSPTPPRRYAAAPATMAALVGWLRQAAETAATAERSALGLWRAQAARAQAKTAGTLAAEAADDGANR